MIELRSDTLTQPTPGMRQAIANAVVGDEQKREDPTVIELEERAAALLGQEAAVFLPTATMANQIAIRILTEPGDELLAEENAHIMISEQGGPAVLSGLVMRALPGRAGRLTPEQISSSIRDHASGHKRPPALLCVFSSVTRRVRGEWPLAWSRTEPRICSGVSRPAWPGSARMTSPESAAGPPCSEIMMCESSSASSSSPGSVRILIAI